MKTKHAILIFNIGLLFSIIGTIIKILHLPFSQIILLIGLITELIGVILFLYKLFTYPKFKDFLNW